MKTLYVISSFILFISCSNKHETSMNCKEIHYHDLKIHAIKEIPSHILKQKKSILLTGEEEDFLFAQIDRIMLHHHRIYIQDSKTKSLLVFDTNGQGIKKIGNFGRGPGEYTNIAYFDIDKKGNIYLLDGQQDKLNVYNSQYKSIKTIPLKYEVDIIKNLEEGNLLLGLSSWNEKTKKRIMLVDSSMHVLHEFGEYDMNFDDNMWLFDYQFTESEQYLIYNRPIDNNIYLFGKNGEHEKTIRFDFSSHNVPNEARRDILKHYELFDNYYLLGNLSFIHKNYIGGTLFKKRKMEFYLLDTLSNTIYLKTSPIESFLSYQKNKIISYMDPNKYLEHPKTSSLPIEISQHLEKGNFVICIYELK